MLEMLVLHGAQLNVENKSGATPLMQAAEQGLRCTVELLVLMGANRMVRRTVARLPS